MATTLDRGDVAAIGSRESEGREHTVFLVLLLLAAVLILWILPLGSSLWLDEAGTYWVIKDGWRETVDRAIDTQGHTPVYYLVVWATRSLAGSNELVLRLPSLAAAVLAAFLLYRLGRRLFDAEAALLATLAFASMGSIAFVAADARPYAFAICALIGSTLALTRWTESGRVGDAALYAFLAALVVYLQYLFAVAFLVHVALIYRRRRRGAPLGWRSIVPAVIVFALLVSPVMGQLLSLADRRTFLSFPIDRSLSELLRLLAPPNLLVGLLVGLILAGITARWSFRQSNELAPDAGLLVLGWLAVPAVLLFALAHVTETSVFLDRYVVSAAPGLALGVGWFVRSISGPRARRLIVATLVVIALAVEADLAHTAEDWRGAIAAVNAQALDPSTPVLLHAAPIDSSRIDWLDDAERVPYINSPATYYPLRGHVIAMPYTLGKAGEPYLERLTRSLLLQQRRFMLVSRFPLVGYRLWLEGRLRTAGFVSRAVGAFGRVEVTLFERSPSR